MNQHMRSVAATAWAVAVVLAAAGVTDVVAKEKKASKSAEKTSEVKKSEPGFIGIYMQELSADVRKGLDLKVTEGVLVSGVQDDSPAEKAGIEEGDVITAFGGKDVDSPDQLRDLVREFEPGAEARLELVRDGASRSLTLTVGERPEHETWSFVTPNSGDFGDMHNAFTMIAGPRLGINAHEIEKDDDLASYFGAKEGVLVLGVEDESVAAKAGVKAGDVIQTIGDEKVTDVGDLREAVREFDEGDEFTIGVLRHGKTQKLTATMDQQEFSFYDGGMMRYAPRALRVPRTPRVHVDRESLRDEINDLKKEIREMKEQLERQDS